jgi:hypothetical protein
MFVPLLQHLPSIGSSVSTQVTVSELEFSSQRSTLRSRIHKLSIMTNTEDVKQISEMAESCML